MRTLLFDIGATHTRLAIASGGHMGAAVHMPTDRGAEGFGRLVAQMRHVAGDAHLDRIVGGMRAQREGADGRQVLDTELIGWLGVPVRARLEEAFDCPVLIENDATMAGLGEAHTGAGINQGVMVYVTVSTGVNMVRLVDGRPDATIRRFELGRQLVGEVGGKAVSLEELTGGAALEAQYGRPPADLRNAGVWRGEREHLARGLYNMMLFWMPQVVVFGGAMMRDIDLVALKHELSTWEPMWIEEPKFVRAKLGDEAGLRGALWLSQQLSSDA